MNRAWIVALTTCAGLGACSVAAAAGRSPGSETGRPPVQVELFESLPAGKELELEAAEPVETYAEPAFGFVRTPVKYSLNALPLDRSTPFVLRATQEAALPAGTYEFRLRSKSTARFSIDGKVLAQTKAQKPNGSAHEEVLPDPPKTDVPMRLLPVPHQEVLIPVTLDGAAHRFTLVAVIGGKGLTPTPGELSVSYRKPGAVPRLLGGDEAPLLTDDGWEAYAARAEARHRSQDTLRRRALSAPVAAAWAERHNKIRGWLSTQPAPKLPVLPAGMPGFNGVDRFLGAELRAARVAPTPLTSDLEFLRRLSLDTTGVIPTAEEIRRFLADPQATRRKRAIDRYLAHPGWADHWVSYWQDVLAENPGILKPDLNNSGPFRWWLHQSLADNLPFDRLVTELVQMQGSAVQGAPSGFAEATFNDAPMAAKADILSQAFLGQNLSCARCHDAPAHPFKQRQLFAVSAMLTGKAVTIPESSTVRVVEGFHVPRVSVTTRPGEPIAPAWPFAELAPKTTFPVPAPFLPEKGAKAAALATRTDLASLIVAPENERFAQVLVNRVWQRLMGKGLVEPADDWVRGQPSNPRLLRYLAREFVASSYDVKRVARLILSSHAYQRKAMAAPPEESTPADRLFAGPYRRRMTAEQLVDSLYRGVGKQFRSEPLNLSPLGDRPLTQFLDLGTPCRAWEFTALSNERDRPSLALPVAQSIGDVLTVYGWRQARQNPITLRDDDPTPIQTLILANGVMGTRITRLSDDSAFTELCLENRPLNQLVGELFLRVLSRLPSQKESLAFQEYLRPHYAGRVVKGAVKRKSLLGSDKRVSWANHLSEKANEIRLEEERRLRLGDEPTARLTPAFRERFEDVLWAVVNSSEFVVVP